MRSWTAAGACIVVALGCSAVSGGAVLDPQPAPDWEVREWINGDPGSITRYRDKVVLLEFFQLWCPGCNSFSQPLFKRWQERYGKREDVLMLSIHSVFEGHDYQTDQRLRDFIALNEITRPVGLDKYESPGDLVPITMKRYGAMGTPHIVIIGKDSKVHFSAFGPFSIEPVEAFIDRMLADGESAFAKAKVTAPVERPDTMLSGAYTVTFEQTSSTCGPVAPPFTVPVKVDVFPAEVQLQFSKGYLDFNHLTLHFDPQSKGFQLRTRRRALLKQGSVTLAVEITGKFLEGVVPPEFEFEAKLEKEADDPGANCQVDLRGRGKLGG